MLKYTTLLLLFSLILSISFAKEPVPKQEKCLISDYQNVVFHPISMAQKAETKIVLTSTGLQPVVIKSFKIVSEDSDLSIAVPMAPIVLKPNQTTNIGLAFDPHAAGDATADIFIETDSLTTPTVSIHLTAKAYDPSLNMAFLILPMKTNTAIFYK